MSIGMMERWRRGWVQSLVLARRYTCDERGYNGSLLRGYDEAGSARGWLGAVRGVAGVLLRNAQLDLPGASGWQVQMHDAVVVGVGDD